MPRVEGRCVKRRRQANTSHRMRDALFELKPCRVREIEPVRKQLGNIVDPKKTVQRVEAVFPDDVKQSESCFIGIDVRGKGSVDGDAGVSIVLANSLRLNLRARPRGVRVDVAPHPLPAH